MIHQPVEHPRGPLQRIGGPCGQTKNDGALDGGHDGGGQRFRFVDRDSLVAQPFGKHVLPGREDFTGGVGGRG